MESIRRHRPIPSPLVFSIKRSTYGSEILLIERRSLHGDFQVIEYFGFPWKPVERWWKGFLHMVVCISCHIKPQGIEACKQRAIVRAVIVERNLRLMLGPDKPSLHLGAYFEAKRVGMRT